MPKQSRFHYGFVIVALCFIISVVALGTSASFGVFMEPMLKELGWTRSSISASFSLSNLIAGVAGILAGRLTDKLGPRLVLTATGLCMGAGYLLMPLVHEPWQMYLFYGVFNGIGIAGTIVPISSISIRWFTTRRAMVSGIISSGMAVGTIIFSQLSGWLITVRDWRFTFIVVGIITLVVTVICAQFLKRDPQSVGQLPFGETGRTDVVSLKKPVTGLTLAQSVKKIQFWLFYAANVLGATAVFALTAHIVIHARGLHIPNAAAVTLMSFISITSILSRMTMGFVADKIGHRTTITLGMSLLLISLVCLIFAADYWMLVIFALVFGFSWGTFFVPVSPLTAELFGVKSLGSVFGLLNTSLTAGAAIGPVLAGYIYDINGSYLWAFILLAAFTFLAVILMLVLGLIQKRKLPVQS